MEQRPLFDPGRARGAKKSPAVLGGGPTTLRVSQVNELVRGAIESQLPSTLHVFGEIGDFSRAASGHIYFTLKDAQAELRCVLWRSAAAKLKFQPTVGLEVIATGGIEVYVPRGTYQLVVTRLEPRGIGALELAFRQLREKLEAEGLLDAARRRPLPKLPRRIAVVTSEAGAALRDILTTLARRFPKLEVLVFPVRVQGEGAAAEIAAAIRLMNVHAARLGGIDAAIVGRGGGSLEDLWAFNEEIVARAIVASEIPIISAVGHEVDVSISDLVADVRAATPTAAAELIAPPLTDLVESIERQAARARAAIRVAHSQRTAALREIGRRWPLARPLAAVAHARQRLDELFTLKRLTLARAMRAARDRLHRCEARLWRRQSTAALARMSQRIAIFVHRVRDQAAFMQRRGERRLHAVHTRLHAVAPRLQARIFREQLDQMERRLRAAMSRLADARRRQLSLTCHALDAASPQSVLRRGYSLTRDAKTGRVLRSIAEIRDGLRVRTQLSDGEFSSTAEDPRQPRLFDPP
ncbi:MAG: exodeoxyribonuclease VII large subunit [Phycisphaerales bacterium]|nr:exodeoxyribonuclease VII large subunit [Phycisphaerales bacterium]